MFEMIAPLHGLVILVNSELTIAVISTQCGNHH